MRLKSIKMLAVDKKALCYLAYWAQTHVKRKSHQRSSGHASEPVQKLQFTKVLEKTPLTMITVKVKDFK